MDNGLPNIVREVNRGNIETAVQQWSDLRHTFIGCDPCFYSTLNELVRCASCMEAKLRTVGLIHGIPELDDIEVDTAIDNLGKWVAANVAA